MFGEKLHTYIVYAKEDDTQYLEPELVREGFQFWAFAFGALWLFYHRAWKMAALFLIINAVLNGLQFEAVLSEQSAIILQLLAQIIIGFEGADMRGAALVRRGYDVCEIVRETNEARAILRACDRLNPTLNYDPNYAPHNAPHNAPNYGSAVVS